MRRTVALLTAWAALALAGCGGEQSVLDPHSEPARDIRTLWWWMLFVASVVFLGAVGMLVLAWLRRRREGLPFIGSNSKLDFLLVVLFGIVIPIGVNVTVFAVANFAVMAKTDASAAERSPMTIEVIGKQWFWMVRYPGTTAVTANEIHIPARTRVTVIAHTADVIHSFWVPQLNRKIDMIPGRDNKVVLYADRPGRYRGQCAEFCGVQHAHMAMYVFADPPREFDAWLKREASPRPDPPTAQARRGEQVFLSHQCASCHQIRGTRARGEVGPDLTHVGSRTTLAALTIPNRRGVLGDWILDPQHVKPGNRMPGLQVGKPDLQALLTYLEGLK